MHALTCESEIYNFATTIQQNHSLFQTTHNNPPKMSENIPQSIPTSSTHRPHKKPRLSPISAQGAQLEALFANPDRDIKIPSGPTAAVAQAPPEIVANVQGSSAGAGSGEFHVYKASRRREYERLRIMDEEVEREERDREWEEKRAKAREEEEEKVRKNREKREKAKARKSKKGKGGGAGMEVDGEEESVGSGGTAVKKRLGPAKIAVAPTDGNDGAATGAGEEQVASVEEAGIVIHEDD
jgi:hypothetical protein